MHAFELTVRGLSLGTSCIIFPAMTGSAPSRVKRTHHCKIKGEMPAYTVTQQLATKQVNINMQRNACPTCRSSSFLRWVASKNASGMVTWQPWIAARSELDCTGGPSSMKSVSTSSASHPSTLTGLPWQSSAMSTREGKLLPFSRDWGISWPGLSLREFSSPVRVSSCQ